MVRRAAGSILRSTSLLDRSEIAGRREKRRTAHAALAMGTRRIPRPRLAGRNVAENARLRPEPRAFSDRVVPGNADLAREDDPSSTAPTRRCRPAP